MSDNSASSGRSVRARAVGIDVCSRGVRFAGVAIEAAIAAANTGAIFGASRGTGHANPRHISLPARGFAAVVAILRVGLGASDAGNAAAHRAARIDGAAAFSPRTPGSARSAGRTGTAGAPA